MRYMRDYGACDPFPIPYTYVIYGYVPIVSRAGAYVWHAICNKNRDPVNVTLYLKRNVERLTTLHCTLELDVKPSYMYVLQRHVLRLKRYVVRK